MLEDYNEIMDKIFVSSNLEKSTIEKLKAKSIKDTKQARLSGLKNKNVNGNVKFLRNSSTIVICTAILILCIAAFSKVQLLSNIAHWKSLRSIVQNPTSETEASVQNKKTMIYSPNTVQYRLESEDPTSIDHSDTADVIAPVHTNLKSLYAYSQGVIKGYVYSTEYFWVKSEAFTTLFTKSVIVIEKSYKPEIKQDDRITVFEHGGVATLRDFVEKTSVKEKKDFETKPENFDPYFGKSPDTLIDYKSLLGVSAMRTKQEVVLFLRQENFQSLGEYSGLGYWVNSAEGGKMVLDKGIYKQIIPEVYQDSITSNSIEEKNLDKLMRYASGEGEKP